ncbi:MAG: biotin transporter BioY [Actinobacteria bacterium]|nr:biotin transporter BioY [Actinomycetota bacterium]
MSRLTTREVTAAALLTALLAVSAFVAIPLGSVPFTLQVFVVLLAGMILGPRLGLLSVIAYLVLGLLAPVYAGGASGLGALLGPTGGYLWSFPVAVVMGGVLVRDSAMTLPRLLLAGVAGLLPIYALGATWLALQLDLSPGTAVLTGVLPFVWVDLIKAAAAALTARALVTLPLGLPAVPPRGR